MMTERERTKTGIATSEITLWIVTDEETIEGTQNDERNQTKIDGTRNRRGNFLRDECRELTWEYGWEPNTDMIVPQPEQRRPKDIN